jgi:hypothetical protein
MPERRGGADHADGPLVCPVNKPGAQKSPGAASIRARSIVDDSTAEIYSAVVSEETCNVQNVKRLSTVTERRFSGAVVGSLTRRFK